MRMDAKRTLPLLVVYVFIWYASNVRYNIVNKMLLKSLHATVIIAWAQLAFGVVVAVCLWRCGVLPTPSVSRGDILALVPASMAFAAGQITTQAALTLGHVSLTHVVKSVEPVVNAIFSALFLGECLNPFTYLTLVPIVLGVCLTANSWGFDVSTLACAMASNVCFALRNVLASKYGRIGDLGEDPTVRKTNQLFLLTVLGSAISLPFVTLISLFRLQSLFDAWADALSKVSSSEICRMLVESCVFFLVYQVSSFWVLSLMQPISHSVLNSMKRVVVIMSAIVLLHEPVTTLGSVGVALSTAGAIAYSLAKRKLQNDAPWTWYPRLSVICVIVPVILSPILLPTCSTMYASGAFSASNVQLTLQLEGTRLLPATRLVLVAIPSSAACDGQIHHLTCLNTIIASTSGPLAWEDDMSEPLCRELIAGRDGAISHADVGLCLQMNGHLGAVAHIDKDVSKPAGTFQRCASASELGQVLQLLPGEPRVVNRKHV